MIDNFAMPTFCMIHLVSITLVLGVRGSSFLPSELNELADLRQLFDGIPSDIWDDDTKSIGSLAGHPAPRGFAGLVTSKGSLGATLGGRASYPRFTDEEDSILFDLIRRRTFTKDVVEAALRNQRRYRKVRRHVGSSEFVYKAQKAGIRRSLVVSALMQGMATYKSLVVSDVDVCACTVAEEPQASSQNHASSQGTSLPRGDYGIIERQVPLRRFSNAEDQEILRLVFLGVVSLAHTEHPNLRRRNIERLRAHARSAAFVQWANRQGVSRDDIERAILAGHSNRLLLKGPVDHV